MATDFYENVWLSDFASLTWLHLAENKDAFRYESHQQQYLYRLQIKR
ncbi:hypothetical protein D515_00185 [Grimontia indica]|uniref:Uncharacterized protein n=1 Tax=Grimontia indica TaxID=1056512 RepID=R1GX62_9GAMM|nr:hypothetical protein D515_00185 [Grimontia indica]